MLAASRTVPAFWVMAPPRLTTVRSSPLVRLPSRVPPARSVRAVLPATTRVPLAPCSKSVDTFRSLPVPVVEKAPPLCA